MDPEAQLPASDRPSDEDVLAPAIVASPEPDPPPRRPSLLRELGRFILTHDKAIYSVFSLGVIAWIAATFVSAMLVQTGGEWSAPLDDVFIHFDYARSTARGYPFHWSEGNGYSSGNTSVTYPFVLAIGYWIGARDERLMAWSVLTACASLLVFFLATSKLTKPQGKYAKYFAPPLVLSLGALDWSLMSGMENAFHLGVWGLTLLSVLALTRGPREATSPAWGKAMFAGFMGAMLVLTRPESIVCIASFALFTLFAWRKTFLRALGLSSIVAGLPAATLFGQACVNRALTGEWSQAGSLAKLAIYHPYMNSDAKLAEWKFLVKYVLARNLEYHFTDAGYYGYIIPALALVPFFDRRIRHFALLLWPQVVGWLLLVAMNGQVRWQNERYTMAAVAWLFLLAAMGVSTLASHFGTTLVGRVSWAARVGLAGLALSLFLHHQIPRFRDQVWFFARASRNIRDQHITAGKVLARLNPPPRRIAVGDAGALLYASDRPGLDLIGLGGYKNYPFARAGRHGLGATVELIEHMPVNERPDVLALYPSWWGDLPILFGRYIGEVPVYGNVICGGASKALYRANWAALDRKGSPLTLAEGESVTAELDVADLMSERDARYTFPSPEMGWVVFHVLPKQDLLGIDLFDAGRVIPAGQRETATLSFPPKGRLIVRTANTRPAVVLVRVGDREIGKLDIAAAKKGWVETSVALPSDLSGEREISLEPIEGEWTNYHLWIVAAP